MPGAEQQKGFFASLFDFSFTSFVTLKLVKFLFALGLIGGVIGALVFIVSGFIQGAPPLMIATAVVLAPLSLALFIIYLRVILEMLVVLFRIADNTGEIARQGRQP